MEGECGELLIVEAALLQAGDQEPLVEFIPSPKA